MTEDILKDKQRLERIENCVWKIKDILAINRWCWLYFKVFFDFASPNQLMSLNLQKIAQLTPPKSIKHALNLRTDELTKGFPLENK